MLVPFVLQEGLAFASLLHPKRAKDLAASEHVGAPRGIEQDTKAADSELPTCQKASGFD